MTLNTKNNEDLPRHPNLTFCRTHHRGGQKNKEMRIKQPTNHKTTDAGHLPAVRDHASTFLVQ